MDDIKVDGVDMVGASMPASGLFYERRASTLAAPVPANATGHILFRFDKRDTRSLQITSLGTSQHDNAVYRWYIDGILVDSISGRAAIGTILHPYVFPRPIRVDISIELQVDNNNPKPYPNDDATSVVDRIPFECVVNGIWR